MGQKCLSPEQSGKADDLDRSLLPLEQKVEVAQADLLAKIEARTPAPAEPVKPQIAVTPNTQRGPRGSYTADLVSGKYD